ncbi:MAG: rsbW [Ignavibacteria bacterium]|nr:rsbW [Ignavibacteria bacterium]
MMKLVFSFRKEFDSDKKSIKFIEAVLQDLKKALSIDEETYYGIVISTSEGMNNAIYHGNKCNPEKKACLSIEATKKEIIFIIEDEGLGFSFDDLPDPRIPENLYKDHGRGVFIIRNFMDTVDFIHSGRGTKLIMKKKIKN